MEKLNVENFRNIETKEEFDLAQITILTGKNNSGKSTILKLLILLSDYFKTDNHLFLNFNGPSARRHKIDCYQNAVNWSNWNTNKKLRVSYKRHHYLITLEFAPSPNPPESNKSLDIQTGILNLFNILNETNKSRIELKRLSDEIFEIYVDQSFISTLSNKTESQDIVLERIMNLEKEVYKLEDQINRLYSENKDLEKNDRRYFQNINDINKTEKDINAFKQQLRVLKSESEKASTKELFFNKEININGLNSTDLSIPAIIEASIRDYYSTATLRNLGASNRLTERHDLFKLRRELNKILRVSAVHLGPDRTHQMRLYLNENKSSDLSEIITSRAQDPFKKGSPADRFLIKWMKKFDIGTAYRIENYKSIASYIEIKDKEVWVNLVDKGFGAGQILPILLRIAEYIEQYDRNRIKFSNVSKEYPPLILIEEPEANLHPAFQSLLADMFHDVMTIHFIRLIIETHSEYLIRKLKLLRAKKEIAADETVIYYLDSWLDPLEENPHRAEKIEILENGTLSKPFGKGFFDATDEIEMDLYRLNKGRL